MGLEKEREAIDEIDSQLTQLFVRRMEIARRIGDYKLAHNLPVLDRSREREVLARAAQQAGDELGDYTKVLYATMMDLSRSYQNSRLSEESPVCSHIRQALEQGERAFPQGATVACQGVEGAYSQQACDKLFSRPSILYFRTFEGVFQAVDRGLCRYGILPIENSTAGSVNGVYDLMRRYRFHIVRGVRLRVEHTLLAKSGTALEDVTEIFSHEQGIQQCSAFLKDHPGIRATVCENTAVAARMVAESSRKDVAAISSRDCAALYGLTVLTDQVQNSPNNHTRFICISKELEIYPGAGKTSLMLELPHRPGSLYGVLARMAALDLNLTKLESRPIPGKDFEFMFYFDLEASVHDPRTLALIGQLERDVEQFTYLGSYSEIV